jgi:hypothetical protein
VVSIHLSSEIAHRAIVSLAVIATKVRGLLVALHLDQFLGRSLGDFRLNPGNVRDVLGKAGHAGRAPENLDVILQFSAVLCVILVRADIGAVNGSGLFRRSVVVYQPAKAGVGRFA